jgi:peptidoglycan/xylan/chitin deacetylase (PgdA/CDA1 family)
MREYGSRVGVFRLIETLARHGVRATLAIDAHTALHRRPIARECLRHGWDIAAHGWTATQVISSQMSDEEERLYVRSALDAIERGTGVRPTGWHGAEYGESLRTPALLAEHGITHLLDWPNDEQPLTMHTAAGELVSIPMSADLDDVFAHWQRKLTMKRWMQSVMDAVDTLADDGRASGRVLVLNLHPWLSGQPYRTTYVDELLTALKLRNDIWWTSPSGIATWFRRTHA